MALLEAYLDDVIDVLPAAAAAVAATAVAATFKRLLDAELGLSSIGLELNPGMCGVHGSNTEVVAAAAHELRIGHTYQGVMSVGTSLGTPAFVDTKLRKKAEDVQSQVDTLVTLSLSAQTNSKFLFLRALLDLRRPHIMSTVPCEALEPHAQRAQLAV